MMLWQSLLLGIIEGLTEFLPVSSTFHLIWMSRWLGLPATEFQKMFEVVIQAGAILAVVTLYFETLRRDHALLKKVIVSFIPTAVVGLMIYKVIKSYFFDNYALQLAVFALIGLLFILYETRRRSPLLQDLTSLSYKQAAIVGFAQALAVVPGVSRAGAVMLALMLLGTRRDEAAKYSFLLAVPTILAAAALDLLKAPAVTASAQNWLALAVGFAAAFLSALLVIKWFISFIQKYSLTAFGWYRILLAGLLWLIFK